MSPKQKLRRYFSNRDAILNSRMGGWLGEHLHDPEIWHFGRRAVAGGVGIGFFLALNWYYLYFIHRKSLK